MSRCLYWTDRLLPGYVSGWVVVVEGRAHGIAVTVFLRCVEIGSFLQLLASELDLWNWEIRCT